MHEAIDRAWQCAASEGRISVERKAELRLAAANATWSCTDAVDRLYHAAGGSAIYRTSNLQKCFRDIHVTTQHMMVAQNMFEVTGRVLLGQDPKSPL